MHETMHDVRKVNIPLRDLIAFIRVQIKRGGYSYHSYIGTATCPAELMLNIDAILDAAERGASPQQQPDLNLMNGGLP